MGILSEPAVIDADSEGMYDGFADEVVEGGEAPEGATEIDPDSPVEEIKTEEDAPRMFKVKVDGVETEVTEEELVSGYQIRKASDKAFRQAAGIRQQNESIMKMLKTDPMKVLNHPKLGHDVRKLAEKELYRLIQDDMMSPEQKQQRSDMNELKQHRDVQQRHAAQQREAQQQEQHQAITAQVQKEIIGVLEEHQDLPKNDYTVKRIAGYMAAVIENQRGDVTTDQIAKWVKEDYQNEIKSLLGSAKEESLLELLGDDVAGKLRKADLNRLRTPQDNLRTPERKAGTAPKRNGGGKKQSSDKFFKSLRDF